MEIPKSVFICVQFLFLIGEKKVFGAEVLELYWNTPGTVQKIKQ